MVYRVALAQLGVLSSKAIKTLSLCVLPGWGTGFGTEKGNLLTGAAEQWPGFTSWKI